MSLRVPRRRRARSPLAALPAVLLLLIVLLSRPALAQETAEDLARGWFFTEVVIFLRPQVADFAVEEDLVQFDGALLPRTVRSFRVPDGQIGQGYDLAPEARAFLTFPILDLLQPEAPAPATDEPEARPPPEIEPVMTPDPVLDDLRAAADQAADLDARSYRWLEPGTFTLRNEANRLTQAGYRVLLHGRWLQPVPERNAPQPLLLQAGPRYGNVHALEGTLDVTRGRFLHFHANLFYREPLLGSTPLDRAQAPISGNGATAAPANPSLEDLSTGGFMHLQESRRVRSGELHYLDHPKLGVLVRIEPATLPARGSAGSAEEPGQ